MGHSSWSALLSGATAERALGLAHRIAHDIARNTEVPSDPWLAQGDAGYAVFFHHAARLWPEFTPHAERWIESCVERVNAGRVRPMFQLGVFGVAWAAEMVTEDPEFGEPFDELVDELLAAPWDHSVELRDGLSGLAHYALVRAPRPSSMRSLERYISRMAELAERRPHGIAWRTPMHPGMVFPGRPSTYPEGYFDVGMAHGMPGVLITLAACARRLDSQLARELATGCFDWVISCASPAFGQPSFPSFLHGTARFDEGFDQVCYGDPGVSLCLVQAAHACGSEVMQRTASEVAASTAKRIIDGSPMSRADLCCGSAGIGHAFHRILKTTGATWAGEAAEVALQDAMTQSAGPVTSPSLGHGAAGVALALIAAATNLEPTWDVAFGFSLP